MMNNISHYSSNSQGAYFNNQPNYSSFEIGHRELKLKARSILGNLPFETAACAIKIQENIVTIKLRKTESPDHLPPERKKNDITKFSINSRRRMQRLLSSINLSSYLTPIFVTLTFHNIYPSDSKELSQLLRNYFKRILRQFPSIQYVWRLEWQKRQAPHYHIIFFIPPIYDGKRYIRLKKDIRRFWFPYLKDHDYFTWKYAVDVKELSNKKQLYSYVSKYTAKEETESENIHFGKRWNYSKNLDTSEKFLYELDLDFANFLKKKFWERLKKIFSKNSEFAKIYFDAGQISFLMDSTEAALIFSKAMQEFEFK